MNNFKKQKHSMQEHSSVSMKIDNAEIMNYQEIRNQTSNSDY